MTRNWLGRVRRWRHPPNCDERGEDDSNLEKEQPVSYFSSPSRQARSFSSPAAAAGAVRTATAAPRPPWIRISLLSYTTIIVAHSSKNSIPALCHRMLLRRLLDHNTVLGYTLHKIPLLPRPPLLAHRHQLDVHQCMHHLLRKISGHMLVTMSSPHASRKILLSTLPLRRKSPNAASSTLPLA